MNPWTLIIFYRLYVRHFALMRAMSESGAHEPSALPSRGLMQRIPGTWEGR